MVQSLELDWILGKKSSDKLGKYKSYFAPGFSMVSKSMETTVHALSG
jgi:hypothetical protein